MLGPDGDSSRRALLRVPEVAAMLGCGRTLVYELIGSRQLPVVKVGRLTRVPVVAVDDFVNRHLTNTMSPALDAPPHPIRPPARQSAALVAGGVHGDGHRRGSRIAAAAQQCLMDVDTDAS